MSNDKRKVSTDALETLGTIIEEGGRDAIHLAVEPVIAGEILMPGQRIGIVDGKAIGDTKQVGIVDPFLSKPVAIGQKFWLVVFPRTITSLRHVWEHPDFETKAEPFIKDLSKSASEKWLRDWCDQTNDIDYEDLIAVMTGGPVSQSEGYGDRWSNEGDYLLSRGFDNNTYDIPLEVWVHVENVIGKKLDSYPAHFSCTC